MELVAYLKERGATDADFANAIGVDRSSVTRMRNGGQVPSADVMRRIADVTDGLVTPNDFFGVKTPARAESTAA